MKEEEWSNLNRPYNVYPKGRDWTEGWHFDECDECGEIMSFSEYPADGDVLCVECGLRLNDKDEYEKRLY